MVVRVPYAFRRPPVPGLGPRLRHAGTWVRISWQMVPACETPRVTAEDRNAHRAFVAALGSDGVWLDYFVVRSAAA